MNNDDTLRPEYPADLIKSGVRGKYAGRYREGAKWFYIDPDLHGLFPDSEFVHRATVALCCRELPGTCTHSRSPVVSRLLTGLSTYEFLGSSFQGFTIGYPAYRPSG